MPTQFENGSATPVIINFSETAILLNKYLILQLYFCVKSISSRSTLDNGPSFSFEIVKFFKDSELAFAGPDISGLDNNEFSIMIEFL